jgi:hypothetical protein
LKLSLIGRGISAAAIMIVSAAVFTACNGSSTEAVPRTGATGPATVPQLTAASAATSVPVAAAPAAVAAPPVGGVTATLSLPAAAALPPNTTLSLTSSTTTPAASTGITSLSSFGRSIKDASSSQITTLVYEFFGFSNPTNTAISFPSFPALSFTLPSFYTLATGGDYYVAYYNGTAWQRPVTSPGVVSGQTITFTAPAGAPTYLANVTYGFALYYQPFAAPTPAPVNTATPATTPTPIASATPTPTPTPTPVAATPTPTPTPTPAPGTITSSLTTLDFGNTDPTQTLSFALSQANVASPTFTIGGTCTSAIATVGQPTAVGSTQVYVVAPHGVGTCNIVATGANNQTITIPVIVTSLSVVAQ